MLKRSFDIFVSGVGIVLLCPLLLLIALLIKLDSSGPIFFRQERVGLLGKKFQIHKFRTMEVESESKGLQITVGLDRRITRTGFFLRKYKLDELAQLIDVLFGDMSLVGPRPEVTPYVEYYPPEARAIVQSVKPGITDWASIKFKDESQILAAASDPHLAYINEVMPIKIKYYVDYAQEHSFWGDLRIIFATFSSLIR
ncbi:sugar transferase [Polynucleobacter paneuropaeus]|uniref:sugar transferase n=1 Tax=Polynucleobacter paneuropaeus TaxID=2527775 RepID=UPI001BFE7CFE|nr:sugar transferase [Polynucleobacter paneuropaeus]QWD07427.1 sugar transferase [Polynucleobacter paneuropaeus]QWD30537.1 sugar transferase [Polynucleobacter paneuropaeus]QWD49302.1 sugar transferase [Polynucleobacter paneuropaeus]QWD54114.1 sugar transferase [Polynucleobacter paneuropaeus]QWD59035.1 sugar transferase [Polynucleobacter paneuropaeus]